MKRNREIPVFGRADAGKLFKNGRKVSRIMIAHHLGDGINIDVGAPQQFLRAVYADLVDMVRQGDAGGLFEGSA